LNIRPAARVASEAIFGDGRAANLDDYATHRI
jgi:hypothetical protein